MAPKDHEALKIAGTYVPEGAESYPSHYMVWVWIGGMAILSPIGLLVFRKVFRRAEDVNIARIEAAAAETKATKESGSSG